MSQLYAVKMKNSASADIFDRMRINSEEIFFKKEEIQLMNQAQKIVP